MICFVHVFLGKGFVIIVVLCIWHNIIRTPEKSPKVIVHLRKEFEMKNLGKTKFCLRLQIEYFKKWNFVYQSTHITKLFKKFYIDNLHPLCTLIVSRSLDVNKGSLTPKDEDEEFISLKVLYISTMNLLVLKYHTLVLWIYWSRCTIH